MAICSMDPLLPDRIAVTRRSHQARVRIQIISWSLRFLEGFSLEGGADERRTFSCGVFPFGLSLGSG